MYTKASEFLILLVDDDPTIAEVLSRAAKETFPEARFLPITTFSEAVQYLEGLHGAGPRLMLLDIDLGSESSGFDFLAQVRQHPQGCLVPVIVLSALRTEPQAIEAYKLGANVFTPKPFSYQDWKTYAGRLRSYWFETATVPLLWFSQSSDASVE